MKPRSFSFDLRRQFRRPNIYDPSGQMQIFAVGLGGGVAGVDGGNLYTMWKLTWDPNAAWSDVVNLGNPGYQFNGVFLISVSPNFSRFSGLPDNRMHVFVAGNGNVYSIYKLTWDPNSAWSSWVNLGSPNPGGEAPAGPSVGYLPDGRMQIFVKAGNVYSMYKLTRDPNSAWSSWTSLGSPVSWPEVCGNTIAVGFLPDDRMQIFTTAFDDTTDNLGAVYTMWKLTTDPGSAWSSWTSLGSPGGIYSGDVAAGSLPDGRMQIFICTRDGTVHTMYKLTTDPSSRWSGWTNLGSVGTGIDSVYFAGVSVGKVSDGRMQIFVMGNDGNVYTMWKLTTDPGSAWSSWTSLGSPGTAFSPGYVCGIAVGYLPDGRMQIFLQGRDGKLYTMYKLTSDPGSHWSQWLTLGNAGPAYSGAQITYGVAVGYQFF